MLAARIPLLFLVLLVSGCTERGLTQLYVPLGAGAGFGYSDQPLSDNRVQVVYDAPIQSAFSYAGPDGRRATDVELARAYDFALLRAADLALSRGFKAFRVVNRVNDADVRNYVEYAPPFHWRWPYRHWGWPYGWVAPDYYAVLSARVTLTVDLLTDVERDSFDATRLQYEIKARYSPPQPT
jgi:hypothetical protein